MKKKNIGGGGLSTQPDQQKKTPMQKMRKKKMEKIIKHWKKFPRSFRSLGILQNFISGAANRHAQVKYAKYVVVFFFFSKQSSWYEPFTSFVSFS